MIFCMVFILASCDEDNERGQFSVDSKAPGQVSDIQVVNEKGASRLSFKPPLDEDLLYVEAKYINSLGKEMTVRSSAFTNTMELVGFLKSSVVPVKLIAVDKSMNQSESIEVMIEPLDNAMFDMLATIDYWAIFGGVKLNWVNEAEQELVVEFLEQNSETGLYDTYQNFYTQSPALAVSVRGLDAEESNFGVVLRDEFGQRTDTVKFTETPYFEEQLDDTKFRELPHNTDFNAASFTTGFASLWNNSVSDSYSIMGADIGKTYFTMDFGEKYKLSRFKMWTRSDFTYAHSQPKHIVLYGTDDETVANDPLSEDGWDVIGEWEDEKPSGKPAGAALTDEDLAYFNSGMDFEVDIDADSYRYIRFVTLETWGGTDRMWLAELRFWGQLNSMSDE